MRFVVLLLAVISFTGTAHAQAESKPEWLFGQRQGVSDISLSPDGKQIVYVAPGPGRTSHVYHVSLADKKPKLISRSSGNPDRILSCNFVSNARVACRLYGLFKDGRQINYFSERIAIGTDGGNMKRLGQKRSFYGAGLRQSDGYIINYLPDSDDVLMVWEFVPENNAGSKINRKADGLGVVRLDTRTGRWKGVEKARGTASDFFADSDGNVRVMGFEDPGVDGYDTTVTRYSYRKPGEKRLNDLSVYDYSNRSGFRPLTVDGAKNLVYGLEPYDGRLALFSIALDGSRTKQLVYAHPEVDVSGVKRFGRERRVVGAYYTDEYSQVEFFDKSLKSLSGQLANALPGKPSIQFLDTSLDENILLVFAGSDRDPGRYYLFDRKQKRLEEIMLERPQLEKVELATVKPINYPTPDGVTIPGYLTLPNGENVKNLPTIIMPHGGPSSRDVWGFDWLAQYFVNQGYAVLQPNFRGSSGYGQAWFEVNGFKQWDVAIGDVTAGAKWLLSEGVADPDKLAIIGWSYGGYAALQSAVTEPELYKAVVAIAPVTDLPQFVEEWRGYTNFSNVLDYIGTGPHLTQGSPAKNARKVNAPVLLFHGDMDLNVNVAQSRTMESALKNAGKTARYFEYEGLDHGLPDSEIRTEMLNEIDGFLDQHLNK